VKWSHCNGWPTQMKSGNWSYCYGWPIHMKGGGLIMMGDLPKWKVVVSLWWVTYPNRRWTKYEVVSLLWVTYPNERVESDLPGTKTWLAKSWQEKADKRCFLIAWLTWRLLLMIGLISSFLWDFSTGRVHLILFSFQDLNRWFFIIIDSMILSVHNLAGLHWGFSCNKSQMCNALRLDDMHASLPDLKYRSPLFDVPSP